MAWSNPVRAGIGSAAPVAFMPALVPFNGIPVTADPDIVGIRLGGHDDHRARRRWRANLDADRYLSFRGNARQQNGGKGGGFQQISHDLVRLLGLHPKVDRFCWLGAGGCPCGCRENKPVPSDGWPGKTACAREPEWRRAVCGRSRGSATI